MRQGQHDRVGTELPADPVFEAAWTEEALDRELADGDDHGRLQHLKFSFQPGRAVEDRLPRRTAVAAVVVGPAREAADDRAHVDMPAEVLFGAEPRPQHPAHELTPGPAAEGATSLLLGGPGRLADEQDPRAETALEGGVGLRQRAVVDAASAGPAAGLVIE